MKSVTQKILISLGFITLIALSVIPIFAHAETTAASVTQAVTNVTLGPIMVVLSPLFYGIMSIAAAALGISGLFLDYIVKISVVQLSENISGIAAINNIWKVIRDLANMSFIFILLYQGIRMVLGLGDGKNSIQNVIKNIIVAAILVNFSLFFTKVIIDASNIITLGFYRSIVSAGTTQVVGYEANFGLAGALMKALRLSSLYSISSLSNLVLNGTQGAIIFTANTIFLLIATFVFLAIAVMFVIRYLSFILLLIMSPFAFVSMAIPGLDDLKSKYVKTLTGQALFAPVFMLMTWVLLTLAGDSGFLKSTVTKSLGDAVATPSPDTISLIIDYVLIIGLLIQTLVISKSVATKGGMISSKIIDRGQAYLGGAVFGSAAWAGRSTLGKWATGIADDKELQKKADMGDRGARMKLAAAQFGAKSSFDARNTKVVEKITGEVTGSFGKGMPWNSKIGDGGYKGTQKAEKDKYKADLDEVVDRYKKKKDWETVAQFMSKQKDADQSYIYEKLSPRDRIAVDEALDAQYSTTNYANPVSTLVRGKLTLEEKEKTEEAGKKAAKVKKDEEKIKLIEELVAGTPSINPATVTAATPAGVPYTYDDLLLGSGRNVFSPKNARNLSIAALNDVSVIERLKPQHLADIMANNDDLDDATIRRIVSTIETGYVAGTPRYAYQAAQYGYINKPANSDNWHI